MHLNTHLLFFPVLFVMGGVLAQLTAEATSNTPDVTYPADDAFVFCSAQDCTGTCEVVNTQDVPRDDAEAAPNDMSFQSIYWYDPGDYAWTLYACNVWACDGVAVGPNTCYNLYANGVATPFVEYYYFVDGVG